MKNYTIATLNLRILYELSYIVSKEGATPKKVHRKNCDGEFSSSKKRSDEA